MNQRQYEGVCHAKTRSSSLLIFFLASVCHQIITLIQWHQSSQVDYTEENYGSDFHSAPPGQQAREKANGLGSITTGFFKNLVHDREQRSERCIREVRVLVYLVPSQWPVAGKTQIEPQVRKLRKRHMFSLPKNKNPSHSVYFNNKTVQR